MVLSCSAYGCNVKFEKGIRFHKFPMNPIVSKAWCIAMRRKNFVPNQHKRLCSKHFTEDCYQLSANGSKKSLKRNAVPTIFDFPKNMSIPQVYVDDKAIKKNKPYCRIRKNPKLIMKKPENNQNTIINTSKENTAVTNGKRFENIILVPCIKTWNNCTLISLPVDPTKAGVIPQRINESIEKDNCKLISIPVTSEVPQSYSVIPEGKSKTAPEIIKVECTPEVYSDDCSSHSTQSNSSTETAESTAPEDESEMCVIECDRTAESVFTDSTDTAESTQSNSSTESADFTTPEDESERCVTECNRTTESVLTDSCYESNESSSDKRSNKLTEDILREHNLEADGLEQRTSKDNCTTSSHEKVKNFLTSQESQIESQQREISFLRSNLRQLRRTVTRYRTLVSHLNKNKLISDEVTKALKWSLS